MGRDEFHFLDETVLDVSLDVGQKNKRQGHHEKARSGRDNPLLREVARVERDGRNGTFAKPESDNGRDREISYSKNRQNSQTENKSQRRTVRERPFVNTQEKRTYNDCRAYRQRPRTAFAQSHIDKSAQRHRGTNQQLFKGDVKNAEHGGKRHQKQRYSVECKQRFGFLCSAGRCNRTDSEKNRKETGEPDSAVRNPLSGNADRKAPACQRQQGQYDQIIRELHFQFREIMYRLSFYKSEKLSHSAERGHFDLFVLTARDGVLKTVPCSRISPVHRRIAKFGNDRHISVKRKTELREKCRTRNGSAVRKNKPNQRENDEIPDERPPEPPCRRMRKTMHSAAGEKQIERKLESGDGDGKTKPLLYENGQGN